MNDITKTYSFSDTLITPEHVICGVKLYPFSLGHWTFLESYSSPLLSDQTYPEEVSNDPNENYQNCIRHLLLFLMVCAHTYEDNLKLNEDGNFYVETKQQFEKHLLTHMKGTKEWNIYYEIYNIKEYLNYYINSMPAFVEKGPPSPPSGIDWKSNIYSVLKNEYGYSQSEIMNMSIRRVYAEWTTYAAKMGVIEVKSKERLESEQKAKEYAEKIREELKK
jgi:hypothetical protein